MAARRWTRAARMTTDDLTARLLLARQHVPFVQANLIETAGDDAAEIEAWRSRLQNGGRYGANDPVPMFPYPSSPGLPRPLGPAG